MDHDRLPGVQIARAVAALSVMYFHSWTALDRFPRGTAHPIAFLAEHGALGVDLFFAISGFVICLVVSRRAAFDALPFMVKRVFRLYPLWLVTLTSFAVLALMWRNPLPSETLGFFLYSASLLPTEQIFPFYDIGWSLQHEMAFYVMVAIVAPWAGVSGIAAFLLCSSVAFYTHVIPLPWWAFRFALYHAEFLAGVLAFIAWRRTTSLGAFIPLAVGLAALCCVIALGAHPYMPLPLFFLVLGFANIRASALPRLGFLVALGDASYSIYLTHPLVFAVVRGFTVAVPKESLWLQEPIRYGAIAITIGVSIASWHYFERWMIGVGNRIAARIRPLRNGTDAPVVASEAGNASVQGWAET